MEKEVVMFGDVVKGTVKRWKIILTVICLTTITGILLALNSSTTEKFIGNTKLYVNENITETVEVEKKDMMPTYMELLKSRGFIEKVIDDTNYKLKYEQVLNVLQSRWVVNTNFIVLEYTANNKKQVKDIMNSVVDNFTVAVKKFNKDASINSVDDLNIITVTEGRNPIKIIILAIIGGIVLGCGLAFVLECINRTYRTKGELERDLEINSLGMIPNLKKNNKSNDNLNEVYNSLAVTIKQNAIKYGKKSFVVTSSVKGEGVTTIAKNLSLSLSNMNEKVLLVDCNLRNSNIAKEFNISNIKGISDVVINNENIEKAIIKYNENIDILPSGTKINNPTEVLNSDKIQELLYKMKEKYEFIIIDSSSIQGVTDTHLILGDVDGVILVVKAEKTSKLLVRDSVKVINKLGENLFGVIFNGADTFRNKFY